ncbi:hypothetical protein JHW43_003009 [Diplocarpon mali]|nr:hypothetical protein JHW43_003009 [Diplocarpon mali]
MSCRQDPVGNLGKCSRLGSWVSDFLATPQAIKSGGWWASTGSQDFESRFDIGTRTYDKSMRLLLLRLVPHLQILSFGWRSPRTPRFSSVNVTSTLLAAEMTELANEGPEAIAPSFIEHRTWKKRGIVTFWSLQIPVLALDIIILSILTGVQANGSETSDGVTDSEAPAWTVVNVVIGFIVFLVDCVEFSIVTLIASSIYAYTVLRTHRQRSRTILEKAATESALAQA